MKRKVPIDYGRFSFDISKGNPGAAVALNKLILEATTTDQDLGLNFMAPIFWLESFGIHGQYIHVLFKDVCKQNSYKLLLLLRATQLDIFSRDKLLEFSRERISSERLSQKEWDDINNKVCSCLKNFRKKELNNDIINSTKNNNKHE